MSVAAWMGLGAFAFLLFWIGYYWALAIGWRAGMSRAGLIVAGLVGMCGCFGLPIILWIWRETERLQLELLSSDPNIDVARSRRERSMLQIAVALAAIGFVGQIVVGRLMPEDAGYDAQSDYAVDDEGYAYEQGWDDPIDSPDYVPTADVSDQVPADDVADEVLEPTADEAIEAEPLVFEEAAVMETGALRAWVIASASDRRTIACTLGRDASVLFVRHERGRALPQVAYGDELSIEGTREGLVLRATSVERVAEGRSEAIPRPRVVRDEMLDDVALAGQYVAIGTVVAIDAGQIATIDTVAPTLRVRLPRGVRMTREQRFAGIRGVIVDTAALGDRRGGLELWVPREEDLVAE